MKKFIYLSLLLFVFEARAQESVNFKMKYLPDHNYNGIVSIAMNCNITLSGDDQIIEKIKSEGINQPIVLTMDMKMNGDTKTGSPGPNSSFPLTMNYKVDQMNINVGGKEIPMPAKMNSAVTIYSHVGADGKLKADSIGGNKLKDTSEQKMSQMINAFQNRIKFPDYPLHVGDKFAQDMPFNIPIAGNNMSSNAKTVYKLVSIANGSAYFDVEQSVDMTIPFKGQSVTLKGAGKGKLVYDLKNSFATDYKTSIDFKFDGKINTLQINGSAQMNMEYKYTIN